MKFGRSSGKSAWRSSWSAGLRPGAFGFAWWFLVFACIALSQAGKPSQLSPAFPFSKQDIRATRVPGADARAGTNRGDCFLIILVDAKGIDYSTSQAFLQTMHKHPRGNKRDRSAGHAWLVLSGPLTWTECGHTGEFGLDQPDYGDSILAALKRNDPNPAACLWRDLQDGRKEYGSGGHQPTAAVRFELTASQHEAIRDFISAYDYRAFSVRDRVCTHFVSRAAALAGVTLGHLVTLNIPQQTSFQGQTVTWWTDSKFSRISFGSPDALEKSLQLAVKKGLGQDVLKQYRY